MVGCSLISSDGVCVRCVPFLVSEHNQCGQVETYQQPLEPKEFCCVFTVLCLLRLQPLKRCGVLMT